MQLLEKCYVIFTLSAFSRNVRNEIKKGRKIYFYDNGIRNAILKNYNPLGLRQDSGALWENFLMTERRKFNAYSRRYTNSFFWRTLTGVEIDYIEDSGGKLHGFEFKWNERKRAKIPNAFHEGYPHANFSVVNRSNYLEFICGKQ